MIMGMRTVLALCGALLVHSVGRAAESTAFTYEGRLQSAGTPANGAYDLTFGIYAGGAGGSPVGGVLTNNNLLITNGLFTCSLDFGNVFDGNPYWLEIGVRPHGGASGFVLLSPRQSLTHTPYAVHALSATTASSTTGAIADSQLSGNVARLNGSASFTGTLTANAFSGNGAGITNLATSNVAGLTAILAAQQSQINGKFSGMRSIIGYYGALGGTNDDTAVFQAALNSGVPTFVDPVTNYTVGNLFLTNKSVLIGHDSVVQFRPSATGHLLWGTNSITNVVLEGIIFDGQSYGMDVNGPWTYTPGFTGVQQNPGDSVPNRSGVFMCSAATGSYITHCQALGFTDAGFRFYGNGAYPQPVVATLTIDNSTATGCWIGFQFTNNAEYVSPVNLKTANCGRGLDIEAGNVFFTGGQDTRDGVAVAVLGGNNGAHSTVSSRTMNHCYIAVQAVGFNNGFNFIGCNVLGGGSIVVTNCAGFVFQGGDFGTRLAYQQVTGFDIVVDGGGPNYFIHNGFIGAQPLIGLVNGGQLVSSENFNMYSGGNPAPFTNAWNNIFTGSNTFTGSLSAGFVSERVLYTNVAGANLNGDGSLDNYSTIVLTNSGAACGVNLPDPTVFEGATRTIKMLGSAANAIATPHGSFGDAGLPGEAGTPPNYFVPANGAVYTFRAIHGRWWVVGKF